jgi:hypothetical protein
LQLPLYSQHRARGKILVASKSYPQVPHRLGKRRKVPSFSHVTLQSRLTRLKELDRALSEADGELNRLGDETRNGEHLSGSDNWNVVLEQIQELKFLLEKMEKYKFQARISWFDLNRFAMLQRVHEGTENAGDETTGETESRGKKDDDVILGLTPCMSNYLILLR